MHFIVYSLLAVGLVQVIYWLFYLIGLLRLRPVKQFDLSAAEGTSVIVAANNEIDNLKELIPAIMNQDYPVFELIIVNDRSSDGTLEYLHDQSKLMDNLKVLNVDDLPDHINGKKYALTLGIKAAQYEQILLTDADCLPFSSDWIAAMSSGFADRDSIVLGFSNYIHFPGFLNYFIRFETLLTAIQYLGSAKMGAPYMGVGRNLAYKKSFFLEHKGFRGYQDIVGGDDDLFVNKHSKAGNTVAMAGAAAMTLSKPEKSLSKFFAQKTRHLSVGKLYSFKTKFFLSLFSLTWIITWVVAIPAYLVSSEPDYVLYLLSGRMLLIIITFFVAKYKLGIAFNVVGIILLDILFTIYYILAGTRALFTRTIKWK